MRDRIDEQLEREEKWTMAMKQELESQQSAVIGGHREALEASLRRTDELMYEADRLQLMRDQLKAHLGIDVSTPWAETLQRASENTEAIESRLATLRQQSDELKDLAERCQELMRESSGLVGEVLAAVRGTLDPIAYDAHGQKKSESPTRLERRG